MKVRSRTFQSLLGMCLWVSVTARGNLAFNFLPDPGTPQYVMDGFAVAADRWSAVLVNDIVVNVIVGYLPLGSGVLGETGAPYVQQSYASVAAALNASATSADDALACAHLQSGPEYSRLINHTSDNPNGANSGTPYVNSLSPVYLTQANAKALDLLGPGAAADATVRFNSNLPFDFNPTDGTTSGQFDFVSVAAHELGHALGFVSAVDELEARNGGLATAQIPSTILDLFRYSANSLAAGAGFSDVTADGRDKFFSVDGGATSLARFATGVVYGSGYQARHWKEFTFVGLMSPETFPGSQRQISNADLRAFDVMGYTRAGVPEPGSGALLLLGLLSANLFFRRSRN
ncbi:MAG: NF038122 family metalloprotease [Verrucomicrobia bacterium]|nr:NF038122 family metalloprotease [Verrucomicrobiota bacterium]